MSPVCRTNSTSGKGSSEVMSASSVGLMSVHSSLLGVEHALMAARVAFVRVPCWLSEYDLMYNRLFLIIARAFPYQGSLISKREVDQ